MQDLPIFLPVHCEEQPIIMYALKIIVFEYNQRSI